MDWIDRLADVVDIASHPVRMVLILIIALVLSRVVNRAISRVLVNMTGGVLTEAAIGKIAGTGTPSDRYIAGRTQRAKTLSGLLHSVANAVIWSIAALMLLSEIGLQLGPLIAGAGIAGVALGFGAQSLVKDFLTGVFMLAEDQYSIGDVIDVGPATGVVEGVGLRITRLRDSDGTVWHIPNGQILRVGNKSQEWSRAILDIKFNHSTDVADATGVIKGVSEQFWRDADFSSVLIEEPEIQGIENLDPEGFSIRLVARTLPQQHWRVARELRQRIRTALASAGMNTISIS